MYFEYINTNFVNVIYFEIFNMITVPSFVMIGQYSIKEYFGFSRPTAVKMLLLPSKILALVEGSV